jgi:hypothetical protein
LVRETITATLCLALFSVLFVLEARDALASH